MKQIVIKNIMLPLGQGEHDATIRAEKKISPLVGRTNIKHLSIYKKSIYARKKDDIKLVYSVMVEVEKLPPSCTDEKLARIGASVLKDEELVLETGEAPLDSAPIVVGFGPGGMFSALLLAEMGYRPIVLERGADVDKRAREVDAFCKTGVLNESTNVQFGAGGAGTFPTENL